MIRYLTKRAISSCIALFLFLTFMFFYAEIMIAHDYTVQFAMIYNRQQRQQIQLVPPTLLVFFTGTLIAFLLGQWLGKVVAWRGPGFLSSSATFSAIALYTTFPPWLGFLVTYAFARRLRWFRAVFTEQPFSYRAPHASAGRPAHDAITHRRCSGRCVYFLSSDSPGIT